MGLRRATGKATTVSSGLTNVVSLLTAMELRQMEQSCELDPAALAAALFVEAMVRSLL